MATLLREMTADDYRDVVGLWGRCSGLGEPETPDEFRRFLDRNPGLSPVAIDDQALIGAVLCGYDGRRGYLYHLAVCPETRRRRVGRRLVDWCLDRLTALQVPRCSIHLYVANSEARSFWRQVGWRDRTDLQVMAIDLPASI